MTTKAFRKPKLPPTPSSSAASRIDQTRETGNDEKVIVIEDGASVEEIIERVRKEDQKETQANWLGSPLDKALASAGKLFDHQQDEEQATSETEVLSIVVTAEQPKPNSSQHSEMGAWRKLEPILGKALPILSELPELEHAEEVLERKFPWFHAVNDIVLETIALAHMSQKPPQLPNMLLYGAPGCGKTEYARTLADLFKTPLTLLPVGGTADDCGLSATDRRWSTSQPSLPVRRMLATGRADHIICIDEIEKSPPIHQQNGSPQSSLMQMLSSRTDYFDLYVGGPINLSTITFIATANELAPLIPPLLDRMLLLHCETPTPQHFPTILDSCIERVCEEKGIPKGVLDLSKRDKMTMKDLWERSRQPSIRTIMKMVERLLAHETRTLLKERVLH